MNGISVIVCCYNSASRLPLALKHLAHQKTPAALCWEIIIVNNNSNDNTVETAQAVWRSLSPGRSLKIIDEKRPGLIFARIAGVKTAQYDIIIFCDDDNLLCENYLHYGYELVRRTRNDGYAIWGGKPAACFEPGSVIPDWFEAEKSNYVIGAQALENGDVSSRGYVWGAGMIILKEVFLKVTGDDLPLLLVGRKENVLLAGDDSEICYRCLIIGYKLYYDENLKLKHYIPAYKLTADYNEGLKKGFSISGAILNKYAAFVYYISGKTYWQRLFYKSVYSLKSILDRLKLRSLTTHDQTALLALFNKKTNYDADFKIMHDLLQQKN
ncbi:MAG TPA: glycosyltransferase [Parafilimonas sp.]|nr:glycosyltransferase [Parafilimonas sp.]